MCDVLSIVGTVLGTTLGAVSGTLSLIDSYSQQEAMNQAIEATYEADVQNARNRYAQQQMQLQEETLQESTKNQQERRESSIESLRSEASAQAAMSSLNVAGNTGARNVVVNATESARADATYEARQEGIEAENLVRGLGIVQEHNGSIDYAKQKAKASWRPIGGTWQNWMNLAGSTLSGFKAGAELDRAGFSDVVTGTAGKVGRALKIS